MKSFKDEERDAEYRLDKMVEYSIDGLCECGFPIDLDNEHYPIGAECICDIKGEEEWVRLKIELSQK